LKLALLGVTYQLLPEFLKHFRIMFLRATKLEATILMFSTEGDLATGKHQETLSKSQ